MALRLVSDGALEGGLRPVGEIGGWRVSYAYRAEFVLSLARDLAVIARNPVRGLVKRASRGGAARIRVPPMSDAWLRVQEIDDDKHRAEL